MPDLDLVFLDANVMFSAAHSPTTDLRRLWSLPDTELITSPYAVEEAQRSLPAIRQVELQVLLETVTLVSTPPAEDMLLPTALILPAKDAPIFFAAAAAGATHLLTGDRRHFGAYLGQRFNGVLILPPRSYLDSRS